MALMLDDPLMDQFPDTYWHTSVFPIYFLPAFTFAHLAR